MSTPFQQIYDLTDIIKTDTRLLNKPKNLIYQLYYSYLKMAISYFKYDCYKDISVANVIPFSQVEYVYVANGITKNFTLDSIPPINNFFYVSIDNMEITQLNYSYDSIDNQIIFDTIPLSKSNIYVASYNIGQFNADLEEREMDILSEGMIIPFLKEHINYSELLSQMVYGSDFKLYSQAAHIKELNDTLLNQQSYLKQLINEYTFKANINGLMGLGGGLI